jgi:hypothetical protein
MGEWRSREKGVIGRGSHVLLVVEPPAFSLDG